MDCSSKRIMLFNNFFINTESFDNRGCNGGLPMWAFSYLQSVAGDETEADYPYTAEVGEVMT